MVQGRGYYELLGLDETATTDEVRFAYRLIASKHHPDKNPNQTQEQLRAFQDQTEAYQILTGKIDAPAAKPSEDELVEEYVAKRFYAILETFLTSDGNDGRDFLKIARESLNSDLRASSGEFIQAQALSSAAEGLKGCVVRFGGGVNHYDSILDGVIRQCDEDMESSEGMVIFLQRCIETLQEYRNA